ncbi:MAG: NAD-dependent epimerase/dehydratase family protein [Myxococcota bacterium]|nr:NAD-dependent epimerase/dehydratase family protein [Myxococcota bacterium]
MAGHTLLTGGAGFIGSNLARHLVEQGHQVRVLDKLTYAGDLKNIEGLDLDFVQGDVCNEDLVASAMRGARLVIHAAAESHVTRSLADAAPFIRSNVEGTRVVVQNAADAGVEHCIHFSTDEVFGSTPLGQRFGTEAPHRPSNAYAASKASAEAFIQAISQRSGYPCTILRMTNNYGPRQHQEKAIPSWIAHALAGQPIPIDGQGTAERDWLHVDDFCRGVLRVIERGTPGGVYHFAGRNSRSNRSVAEFIASLHGHLPIQEGPERPGQDARYWIDDSPTRDHLDWTPQIAFEDGLRSLIQWTAEQIAA